MATLYEIDSQMLELIDPETGEISDPEKLEQLQIERKKKIECVGCWVKNLESDVVCLKAERDAFTDRIKSKERLIEQLKSYITYALQGEKFESEKCLISFRSSEQVEISDESIVPKKFLVRTVSFRPDKKLIKDAIKEGKRVKGCSVISKLNAQIK